VKNLNIAGTVTGSFSTTTFAGAVAGYLEGGAISNVKSTATVSVEINNIFLASVGGITGYLVNAGAITNCYATGPVSILASGASSIFVVGGIAGTNDSNSEITNCYTTGAVSANGGYYAYAGGIASVGNNPVLNNVSLNSSVNATGSTSGAARVGGGGSNYSNNWAISSMLVNGAPVLNGAQDNKNGADFGDKNDISSWTASGPGWTIADSKEDADESNPWWWDDTTDDGHPALYWE
jgi:hypothetical protein